jgi:ferritin
MITETLTKALSNQINAEFYSAYLYLAMSAKADDLGYKGLQSWLYVQAQEEMAHATHMYEHLLERGALPSFDAIAATEDMKALQDVRPIFEKVLAHEVYVTTLINDIASLAMKENDHATYTFISWYVNEQVEEVDVAGTLLKKVKLIENNPGQLYDLDAELATRVFVNPFPKTA